MKKETDMRKKLGWAFICGIALIVIPILSLIISAALSFFFAPESLLFDIYSIIHAIVMLSVSAVFIFGFYLLGKRYDSKFLRIISLIIIVFAVVYYLGSVIGSLAMKSSTLAFQSEMISKAQSLGINLNDTSNLTPEQNTLLGEQILPLYLEFFKPFMIVFLAVFLSTVVLSILFGVGLLKIRKKVRYAKVTGILWIVGGATLILLGLGLLPMLVAYVFELIILYSESKKK